MRLVCAVAAVVFVAIAAPLTTGAAEPQRPDGPPPEENEEFPPYPGRAPERPEGEFKDAEFFWFNENTGAMQWEDPLGIHVDEATGKETYTDPNTGAPLAEMPVDVAWENHWDEEYQLEFYYNEVTKESTWHMPDAFAWQKVYFDEYGDVIAHEVDEEGEEDLWSEDGAELGEFADGEQGSYDAYDVDTAGAEELHDTENSLEEEAEEAALHEEPGGAGSADVEEL